MTRPKLMAVEPLQQPSPDQLRAALADRLAAVRKKPGTRCAVGQWMPTIDASLRADYEQAFADDRWQHAQLHRAMIDDGFEGGRTSIENHRRRQCQCR
jgi:hypothetical protein